VFSGNNSLVQKVHEYLALKSFVQPHLLVERHIDPRRDHEPLLLCCHGDPALQTKRPHQFLPQGLRPTSLIHNNAAFRLKVVVLLTLSATIWDIRTHEKQNNRAFMSIINLSSRGNDASTNK
jgi:hypothetical protein